MPGESYRRRLRSLLSYLCYAFRVLINSLVCHSRNLLNKWNILQIFTTSNSKSRFQVFISMSSICWTKDALRRLVPSKKLAFLKTLVVKYVGESIWLLPPPQFQIYRPSQAAVVVTLLTSCSTASSLTTGDVGCNKRSIRLRL